MAEGVDFGANIHYSKLPVIEAFARDYIAQGGAGPTFRNWNSYSNKTAFETGGRNVSETFSLLPDQTNGGLLVAVRPDQLEVVSGIIQHGLKVITNAIGELPWCPKVCLFWFWCLFLPNQIFKLV